MEHEKLSRSNVVTMSETQVIVALAYTKHDELRSELNRAMRQQCAASQKRLAAFTSYIYFLDMALRILPKCTSRVFRGAACRLSPRMYKVGDVVTWQSFTSATKRPSAVLRALNKWGEELGGTLMVIEPSSASEVKELSVFPDEQEVVFSFNSFFEVISKATSEDEKRALVPDFDAYSLDSLDVYLLRQL